MRVVLSRVDGQAGCGRMQLHISTQDAVDVPLLEQLFHDAPAETKVRLDVERQGDYASANLYWIWPKEGK